jgi:MSHA biogenesis protein MshI
MGLFAREKKAGGWMSIVSSDEGVRVSHIKRSANAMPCVEWIAQYPSTNIADDKPLEKLAKESHAGRYQCTTLLRADEYQVLSVDAPTVPLGELKAAIRWRLKDMLDFHVDDATIDVLDVPVDMDAPGRNHSMYAVAARNQVIEKLQTVFSDAKIPLSVIDIPDIAQRNISALLEQEGRGVALLSFDTDGGLLTITYSGELYLTRRMDVTLAQLTQAGGEQKTACYEKIALELQRSLDHFDRHYHFITLSKLLLAPLPGEGPGLANYLSANLYMPVETFGLETILDIGKVPELKTPDMQQRYFLTLGAALRVEEKAL